MDNYFDELKYEQFAIPFLASHLLDGNLVLFIGAGASKGFGLPDWITFINSLRTDDNIKLPVISNPSISSDELQFAADEVRLKLNNSMPEFINLISKYLYKENAELKLSNALNNHLLVSISALLMGSKRGHVTRVVTLNFDSMLEWFLSLYGFVAKTVHSLPTLEGSEDLRIYHPHGYIPHPLFKGNTSDFVILGMDSVNERLGTTGEPWFEMVRHILDTSVCLFIGMSVNSLKDRALSPLFNTSGKKIKGKRPLGLWIIKDELKHVDHIAFSQNNIVPIEIKEEDEICEFLLKICQEAMSVHNKT